MVYKKLKTRKINYKIKFLKKQNKIFFFIKVRLCFGRVYWGIYIEFLFAVLIVIKSVFAF